MSRFERLADSTQPIVIGVRHHSAALSAAMGPLLDSFAPPAVYIELPADLGDWLPWLGHADLQAPVVVGAAREGRLGFYPFADFSPELAAARWAVARGVPLVACDAPVRAVLPRDTGSGPDRFGPILEAVGARDTADYWDQEIEARAAGSTPEQLRRAALAVGLALREAGASDSDRVREQCMRAHLAAAPAGSVAVVGAFHGWALIEEEPSPELVLADEEAASSLVPYGWQQFDLRSGYPAGVRDPALQQAFYEAFRDGQSPSSVVARAVVSISRDLRRQGHTGGVPDSTEATRMARDLATLRGRTHPGRRELLEAVESTMAQGQRQGRGRALARAMQQTLVGARAGKLPKETPRSGLVVHLEDQLAVLKLPGAGQTGRELRLDPLRSELDRRRQVFLLRLGAASIHYGQPDPSEMETLGARWTVQHVPATEATAALAGLYGLTLEQAAAGTMRSRRARLEREEAWSAALLLSWLATAADAGLLGDAGVALAELIAPEFLDGAGLSELVGALRLLARIQAGHALGTSPGHTLDADPLLQRAVRQVEALGGSEDPGDLTALAELFESLADSLYGATVTRAVQTLADTGSPLMQGGCSALLAMHHDARFGVGLASRVANATHADARSELTSVLRGALTVASGWMATEPAALEPLLDWVDTVSRPDFLQRLPALRGGFQVLSPAARQRLLEDLQERYGAFDDGLNADPVLLGMFAAADSFAQERLQLSPLSLEQHTPARTGGVDRWRLILGRQREKLSPADRRAARALDELYGRGQGEGSRGAGEGADLSESFPVAREWAGELDALFGARVRDEVLAAAAGDGRGAVLELLDPDEVRPSIELLQQVLSLAGSMGEAGLARARRLIARIVSELTGELAKRVRPALTGAMHPRATRRRTRHLDLQRTIRANLTNVRMLPSGPQIVPDKLIYRTGSQRSVDWELFLLVDVSGSMEPSVIHAAMMAAILSAVPFLGVRFFAFQTEVIDLTEHAQDPLVLLLEVKIGGGTHIGKALAYTADQVRVPKRAMVVVISDFEEGGSTGQLLHEVERLVQSGVRCLGIAALDDGGSARYHASTAARVAAAGMPVAAVSPLELARWVGEVLAG